MFQSPPSSCAERLHQLRGADTRRHGRDGLGAAQELGGQGLEATGGRGAAASAPGDGRVPGDEDIGERWKRWENDGKMVAKKKGKDRK